MPVLPKQPLRQPLHPNDLLIRGRRKTACSLTSLFLSKFSNEVAVLKVQDKVPPFWFGYTEVATLQEKRLVMDFTIPLVSSERVK